MSIAHLNTLYHELPELFQPHDLPPFWDDAFIIVPVDDPESMSDFSDFHSDGDALLGFPAVTDSNFPDLEDIGVSQVEPGAPVPESSPLILGVFGQAHGGAPVPYTDHTKMPPPDCFAFYLPFHYYFPTWWGVYLLFEGVVWLAGEIIRRSGGSVSPQQAIQAARLFLYYHEAFHHKTECFATRLELTHRKPFYKTGFESLYQKTFGTVNCLEEGLANASALSDSRKRLSNPSVDGALAAYVLDSPPGYDQGVRVRDDFLPERCAFAEKNQQICLPHLAAINPNVWRTVPQMFNGIANIKSRVNYIIPRSSPLVARLPFRPLLPPSKLVKKLKDLAGLTFVRNGANHDIYKTPSGKKIQIPRHSRDLGRGLIRAILRQVGLDMGLEEFLQQ